jgi:predicted house-cleaning noncanonical NTP pyrophosphatase (MazG superfamily)
VSDILLSDEIDRVDWSDVRQFSDRFGVKGATSLAIPRHWTLPFALVSSGLVSHLKDGAPIESAIGEEALQKILRLAEVSGQLIVRSSVVDETIWDRGTYRSIVVPSGDRFIERVDTAVRDIIASTEGRPTGLMIQRHFVPASSGEFGNLQRISKTRDQWEISVRESGGVTTRQRLNSQRDEAADPNEPLPVRAGLSRERLFGSIGAWLNNEMLIGRPNRLNCEWITDNRYFFLVQIDEEDDDIWGVNPFQVRIPPATRPTASSGHYLKLAEGKSLTEWDKLQVLEQLWEPSASHKPMLFYVPLSELPARATPTAKRQLEEDFRSLIGSAGIVVRTSVRAGTEKVPNLARTDCLTPDAAATWCFDEAKKLAREHDRTGLAFIVHRFVAARASVWCRADPTNPVVEINALWGLPDSLQYCPYDIWDVHVPTAVATDYPDYKSDMLISGDDGSWRYVRVKNELARNNSIGSPEAKEIASRSFDIARRLGRACHIMWFVGCVDADGNHFNIPWYWTEAHEAERNPDRAAYRVFTVEDRASLAEFVGWQGSRVRQALSLRPTDLSLMRDTRFIEAVGTAAKDAQVPIILSGSTLAHAYYQLRKLGCTVVSPGEREHARVRRTTNLGKLVRDKIPERIAQRHELGVTRQMSGNLRKGFLLSKLFEEALEVREANGIEQKTEELADLFEVFRALAKAECVPLEAIRRAADQKKEKAGGFEEGLVLLQTGIGSSDGTKFDSDRVGADVLAERTSEDAAEIPFSFFGFMELDQPRSIYFERLGVRLELVLRPDRLEVRLTKGPEQLGLPLIPDADS